MPPVATRTFNPLPFEHLEPKRFEDLARQLAYDFKTWRQLEATGRAGSDDGFDARGFEIVQGDVLPVVENADEIIDEGATDRLWLIQCKRERSIRPAKMREHLDAIPPESRTDLYGLIFVAACDFSKKTRDVLRAWCSENGISECHVWGKAELEDMLYQPKNDNLLFAYFGISLQFRRQKTATNLRRVTTIKRKLKRLLDNDKFNNIVLIRDPSDERYPFTDGVNFKEGKFLWRVVNAKGLGLFGLRILARQHYAFYDDQTKQFDVATCYNLAIPRDWENPWYSREVTAEERQSETAAHEFCASMPNNNQYHAEFLSEIPYEDIMEIDEVANDDINIPIIYVPFLDQSFPACRDLDVRLTAGFQPTVLISDDMKHVRVFPDNLRNAEFDRHWQEIDEFILSDKIFDVELTPPDWLIERREMRAARDQLPSDDTPPN